MADEKPPPEFMSALVTEHFVLQSAASATIGESGSRVAIYLSSLSSGLIAIGFASSSPHALAALGRHVGVHCRVAANPQDRCDGARPGLSGEICEDVHQRSHGDSDVDWRDF